MSSLAVVGVIVVIVLAVAAGVYFYLGRKPARPQVPHEEPRILPKGGKKEEGSDGKPEGPKAEKAKPGDAPEVPDEAPAGSPQDETRREEPRTALAASAEAESEDLPTEAPDVDQMSDIVVRLHSHSTFTANQAMLAVQPFNQDFGTPLRIQARNQITRMWERIKRGATYTDMVISLQLASRTHVVGELEAGNFAAAVNQAVATLDADSDVVDVPSIVRQAKEVKERISRFGVTLSIGVKAPAPFTPESVLGLSRACGFEIRGNSVQMRDSDSPSPWLQLLPAPGNPNMVVLQLMPVLCTPSRNPLGELFGIANSIAARVGGEITDADGTPLDAAARVGISRQLKFFYKALSMQALEPGTRRAKRLFA